MQENNLTNALSHLTNTLQDLRGDLSKKQVQENILHSQNDCNDLLSTIKTIDKKFGSCSYLLTGIETDLQKLSTSDLCLEDLQSNLQSRLNDFSLLSELEYNLFNEFHQLITRLENENNK